MSIERCPTCSEQYDTDFVEECPRCIYRGDRRPTGSNADEWNLFLDQHKDAPEFVAVQIAEALDKAKGLGPDEETIAAIRAAPVSMMRDAAAKVERLEAASEIIAAAIYNARPYPRSWKEHQDITGGGLHDHFMKEGRNVLHKVLRCLDGKSNV